MVVLTTPTDSNTEAPIDHMTGHTTDEIGHVTDERDHLTDEIDHATDERYHVTDEIDHVTDKRDHVTHNIDHMTDGNAGIGCPPREGSPLLLDDEGSHQITGGEGTSASPQRGGGDQTTLPQIGGTPPPVGGVSLPSEDGEYLPEETIASAQIFVRCSVGNPISEPLSTSHRLTTPPPRPGDEGGPPGNLPFRSALTSRGAALQWTIATSLVLLLSQHLRSPRPIPVPVIQKAWHMIVREPGHPLMVTSPPRRGTYI